MEIKFWILLGTTVLFQFQNCSPIHIERGDITILSVSCDIDDCEKCLRDGFASGFWQQTKKPTMCASCHVQGGQGNGKFGDPVLATAFQEFNSANRFSKIPLRGIDGHGGAITSAANEGWIAESVEIYDDARVKYNACLVKKGEVPPVEDNFPTLRLINKPLNISNVAVGTFTTFTWNLSTDFINAGNSKPGGATLTVEITRFVSPTGDPIKNDRDFYRIRNPRVTVLATGQLVAIKDLRFFYNDQAFLNGTAYQIVDVQIPLGTVRVIGTGEVQVPAGAFADSNTIGPVFGTFD